MCLVTPLHVTTMSSFVKSNGIEVELRKTASYLVLWLTKIVGKDWSGHFLSGVAI